jgi:AraC family transcriptional activator of pobA
MFTIELIKIEPFLSRAFYHLQFETFIILNEGGVGADIDGNEALCPSPFLLYIPKGKYGKIVSNADSTAWVIKHHPDFNVDLFFEFYKSYSCPYFLDFAGLGCFTNIVSLCRMLEFELQNTPVNFSIIQSLNKSLFAIFLSELTKKNEKHLYPNTDNYHLQHFIKLLEQHFKENNSVEFYAEKLVLSSKQLNNITKAFLGYNVNNLITSRRVIEAKKELQFSNKTIEEIGYELGFHEKSYFSRIFKSFTKTTPSLYRSQYLAQMQKSTTIVPNIDTE